MSSPHYLCTRSSKLQQCVATFSFQSDSLTSPRGRQATSSDTVGTEAALYNALLGNGSSHQGNKVHVSKCGRSLKRHIPTLARPRDSSDSSTRFSNLSDLPQRLDLSDSWILCFSRFLGIVLFFHFIKQKLTQEMIPGCRQNQSPPICVTAQTFPGLDYEEHANGSPWFIVNVIPLGVSESNQLGACQN